MMKKFCIEWISHTVDACKEVFCWESIKLFPHGSNPQNQCLLILHNLAINRMVRIRNSKEKEHDRIKSAGFA